MPKSKRSKVVSLTKTDKKTREWKEALFSKIRDSVDAYDYVWVFSVENMRNTYLKDVRKAWDDSKVLFGKTKVMAKALGTTPEDEYQVNLHKLSNKLHGDVGLLVTSNPPKVVTEWFESFVKTDFPRAGTIAPITFTIPEGTVYSRGGQVDPNEDAALPHSLEPTLRQLGMPTRLQKGIITLDNEYTVCKEGDVLDGKQTRLLKQFGIACAEFKVNLVGYWNKKNGDVQILKQANDMDVDDDA